MESCVIVSVDNAYEVKKIVGGLGVWPIILDPCRYQILRIDFFKIFDLVKSWNCLNYDICGSNR